MTSGGIKTICSELSKCLVKLRTRPVLAGLGADIVDYDDAYDFVVVVVDGEEAFVFRFSRGLAVVRHFCLEGQDFAVRGDAPEAPLFITVLVKMKGAPCPLDDQKVLAGP